MSLASNKMFLDRLHTEKAAVLIDNQYLLKVKRSLGLDDKDFRIGYKDLSDYLSNLIPSIRFRTYVYDAIRPTKELKTEKEKETNENQMWFLNSLVDEPNFELRLGLIQKNDHDVYRQKQVDVWMAVDIVRLSLKRIVEHLIIITGDSDFIPAVKVAKEEGIKVHLWHAERKDTSMNLRRLCDTKGDLTRELFTTHRWYPKRNTKD
jgi:uncharacterized LabA/DUF88 family protein